MRAQMKTRPPVQMASGLSGPGATRHSREKDHTMSEHELQTIIGRQRALAKHPSGPQWVMYEALLREKHGLPPCEPVRVEADPGDDDEGDEGDE
jgi:hypothetical protein